ncbi:MFS transporter [Streptomyces sp. NPDC020412]|uniref:MFS transporter n=1 Tax=Streptomyces sp. NPDC020412 TaxID=3365073 RepID=UPI0037A5E712
MAIDQHAAPGSEPHASKAVDRGSAAHRRKAWIVLALLVGLMLVNFADKVVVGLAGVGMKQELGLDDRDFGFIQSSFFWLFSLGSVLGGWLGGKVRARWLLAGVAALWVLSLAPMAFQVGFTTIVACRVLLGFAEGPTTALAMQVAHSWFPAHQRAVPSSIVVAGAGLGPLVAAPVLTWVISEHSWHAAFGVLAVFGAVVVVLWLFGGDAGPESAAGEEGPDGGPAAVVLPQRVPLGSLFRTGTLIGAMLLFFVAYANTAIKVSWLPLYLEEGLGYSATTAGNLVALPYLGSATAVISVGFWSRSLTRRGVSNRITRGVLPAVMVLGSGTCVIAFSALDRGPLQLVLLVLSACLSAAGFGVGFAGLSDVVPARQRGAVFGVVTGFYSAAGIVAPMVMGNMVAAGQTRAGGYGDGFLLLGAFMAVGAVVALLLIHPDRDARKLAELGRGAKIGHPRRPVG